MNIAIETLIHEMEGKLGGYVALLLYRYANLCVKAQPLALLSTIVQDAEEGEMKIEEVAGVQMPDDFHLKVMPYSPHFIFPLCKAIMKEHPEFKQDLVKPEDSRDEDERYIILTMPVVNKDRYDALVDATGVLYDGCKAQLDKTIGTYRLNLEPKLLTLSSDDERDEAKNELEKSKDTHIGFIDQMKADKLKEIEEAYQRYLDEQTSKRNKADEAAAARGEHAGRQMRVGATEE